LIPNLFAAHSGHKAVKALQPGNTPSWWSYRTSRRTTTACTLQHRLYGRWVLHKPHAASTRAVYNSYAFYSASQTQVTAENWRSIDSKLPAQNNQNRFWPTLA